MNTWKNMSIKSNKGAVSKSLFTKNSTANRSNWREKVVAIMCCSRYKWDIECATVNNRYANLTNVIEMSWVIGGFKDEFMDVMLHVPTQSTFLNTCNSASSFTFRKFRRMTTHNNLWRSFKNPIYPVEHVVIQKERKSMTSLVTGPNL